METNDKILEIILSSMKELKIDLNKRFDKVDTKFDKIETTIAKLVTKESCQKLQHECFLKYREKRRQVNLKYVASGVIAGVFGILIIITKYYFQ